MLELSGFLFGRIFVSAPLLFVGVLMVMDPARFLLRLETAAQAVDGLQDYLRGFGGSRTPGPGTARISTRARMLTRMGGVVIAVCAFAHLSGRTALAG